MDQMISRSRTMVEKDSINSAEEIQKNQVEKIIKNWLEIQKTIKVLQSLEEMMEEQHKEHQNKIQKIIKDYYEIKIQERKIYDDIKFLKLNTEGNSPKKRPLDYDLSDNINTLFGQASVGAYDFLFQIRENFDYIPIIVSLIGNDLKKERMQSLAELFCNQFYDNILIPNPEQEELLICIYKLLEYEIDKMQSANVEQFLNDSTFIGTFMSVFSKQNDLNTFLSDLLWKLMYEIENKAEECLDVSLYAIQRSFEREEKKKKEGEKDNEKKNNIEPKKETKEEKVTRMKLIEQTFRDYFPRTNIEFKQIFSIKEENLENNGNEILNNEINDDDEFEIKIKSSTSKNIPSKDEIKIEEITFDYLVKKIKLIKNEDLKAYYIHILNQVEGDPNIYTKDKFMEILSTDSYAHNGTRIINKFKENVLFVKDQVENLMQTLVNKIITIPYTVRCICKIIDILISKKFPKLPKYLRHSFIGKFLFNKCIFPVISLEHKKTLKKIMFSAAQKRCLLTIIDIISSANECNLFTYYNDVEKTLFNSYLLELTPILNKFYDKLINLRLPRQLNEYISHVFENKETPTFLFGKKKPQIKNYKYKPTTYDYFGQNPDELLQIESICFNVDDVMYLKDIIDENSSKFKHLPNFEKTFEQKKTMVKDIENINEYEHNIYEKNKKEKEAGKNCFIVIYKLIISPKLKDFLSRKKFGKNESPLSRMKNCIKIILKGLNLLDIKDYSFLYTATSNKKFFNAIHYSLKDSEEEDGIPLKWYTQYILKCIENKQNQIEDTSYIENDLKKLYEEMLSEQSLLLQERNKLSPEINAMEGMNMECAKRIVAKLRYDKNILEQTKKFQKIETFIAKEHTPICIRVNEKISETKKQKEKLDVLKSLVMKQEKENTEYVEVVNANNCEHRSESFMGKMEGKSDISIKTHAKKVNQFINKFSDPKTPVVKLKNLLQYIHDDIEAGNANHRIFVAFEQYKEILKNDIKIKEPELIEESENNDVRETELNEIVNRIEDHIMQKIYKYVFPINPSKHLEKLDNEFYEKTFLFEWIPPKNVGVKIELGLDEIQGAKISLLRMEENAQALSDKLNCVKEVYNNINKVYEFNTGKKEVLSQEDNLPILNYVILQAHPKRFVSNIHYILCFFNTHRDDYVLMQNLEGAYKYINDLNYKEAQIDKEEFEKNVEKARENFKKIKEKNKNNK